MTLSWQKHDKNVTKLTGKIALACRFSVGFLLKLWRSLTIITFNLTLLDKSCVLSEHAHKHPSLGVHIHQNISTRRPYSDKTYHFTSKTRKRLWNVQKWQMHVQGVRKVLFFFHVKHANLWRSCHRCGYLNCVCNFYMIKQNVYIPLFEGDDWCQPNNKRKLMKRCDFSMLSTKNQ